MAFLPSGGESPTPSPIPPFVAARNARALRMAADTPHSGSRNVSLARLRVKLSSLNDLDRRTGAYKRVAALIAEIESDLGGSENLSTATRTSSSGRPWPVP